MNDLHGYAELCEEYAIKGRNFTRMAEMEDMRKLLIENIKEEINEAIEAGRIPATVRTFSELHDYCDANMLGDVEGLFDDVDSEAFAVFCDETNTAQNAVNAWLESGACLIDCLNKKLSAANYPILNNDQCGVIRENSEECHDMLDDFAARLGIVC